MVGVSTVHVFRGKESVMAVMRHARGLRLAALTVLILAGSGRAYMHNRGNDAAQIFDVGVTVSVKPGFSLYAGSLNILTLGFSHVDG
jgi:hypothetical protein